MCACIGSCCGWCATAPSPRTCISEVFLDVWRQGGSFEGRSAVSTWLLAIARFKALSIAAPEARGGARRRGRGRNRGSGRQSRGTVVEKRDRGEILRQCLTGADRRSPRDHRSRLLPREIRRGGRADRRHSRGDGEDPHVLCAQEAAGLLKAEGVDRGWQLAAGYGCRLPIGRLRPQSTSDFGEASAGDAADPAVSVQTRRRSTSLRRRPGASP